LRASSARFASAQCVGTGVATTAASRGVRQGIVERRRRSCSGVAGCKVAEAPFVRVADPDEVGQLADEIDDVPSPAADVRVGDTDESFQILSLVMPARPVALRRSTTSCASRTSFAQSMPEWAVAITAMSWSAGESGDSSAIPSVAPDGTCGSW
jgi:hypothetical protein